MTDKVFGELSYDGGWVKNEEMVFWGRKQTIRIVVSAYENEKPNGAQQDAYDRLKTDREEISRLSLKKMKKYMKDIEGDIKVYCGIRNLPEDVFELVSISSILFLENGDFAILCRAEWDSHGAAVLCMEEKMEAGPQDIVWIEE